MTRRAKALALAAGAAGALGLTAFGIGSWLTAPAHRAVGPPPDDLGAEAVRIPSASGASLAGWFVPAGAGPRGGVVLLHGVGADRESQVDRARLFRDAGYAVLLFDFQAHGESRGRQISFGWTERHDAVAAVAWLRERVPGAPIAAVGQSMGGAAALYAGPALGADALVVEAVYGSIAEATANRLAMRLGDRSRRLAPLLTGQMGLRLGASSATLSPAEAVRRVAAPILVAGGTADRRATPAEVRRIHANAPEPKALWMLDGAAHEDFYAAAPAAYRAAVLGWLARTLEGDAS